MWNGSTCIRSTIVSQPSNNQTIITTNITSVLSCPIGYYFNGQICVQLSSTITCVPGFVWNITLGNCIRSSIVCFDGYINIGGSCQFNAQTRCPIGLFWNGLSCIQNTGFISCANGFTWNNQGT